MCFPGWAKISLDAKVQLQGATLKPGPAASREIRRLPNFDQAKKLAVKPARRRFAADGHGQLNVIDAINGHVCRLP